MGINFVGFMIFTHLKFFFCELASNMISQWWMTINTKIILHKIIMQKNCSP